MRRPIVDRHHALTLTADTLLPPPSMPEAPYWFDSLSSALALLRRAGSLVPALQDELVECEELLQSTVDTPPDACSAKIITVDGLDGCGKSTLVGELARTLGVTSNAISVRLHRAEKFVRGFIRNEVANTVADPEEYDAEIAAIEAGIASAFGGLFSRKGAGAKGGS